MYSLYLIKFVRNNSIKETQPYSHFWMLNEHYRNHMLLRTHYSPFTFFNLVYWFHQRCHCATFEIVNTKQLIVWITHNTSDAVNVFVLFWQNSFSDLIFCLFSTHNERRWIITKGCETGHEWTNVRSVKIVSVWHRWTVKSLQKWVLLKRQIVVRPFEYCCNSFI